MSSELAVVTAEIVDILPREHQTLANQEWVESSLQNNSVSEVLAACKEYFNVANGKLATCEKRLDKIGVQLDQHIAYTDQRFAAVNSEISQLKQEIAVTKAVNDERANTQQFLTGQMMNSMNLINQNVATVATKSNKGSGYPDPTLWALGAAVAISMLFLVSSLVRVQSIPQKEQSSTQSQVEPPYNSYKCAASAKGNDGKINFASCKKNGDEI